MNSCQSLAMAGLLALATGTLLADDPAQFDPTQRNTPFAAGDTYRADLRENKMADVIASRRFDSTTKTFDRATIQDKRAAIDISERREKTRIEPEQQTYTLKEHETYRRDGEKARIQTTDTMETPGLVDRYQSRIKDAETAAAKASPDINTGESTFEKINRFIFRRNNPDPTPSAGVQAGSAEETSDTYIKP